ncbi:MAG TPA: HAMP domain-containing protein [archaeon]|nr:HAMP domain-containing protein [archaeon]
MASIKVLLVLAFFAVGIVPLALNTFINVAQLETIYKGQVSEEVLDVTVRNFMLIAGLSTIGLLVAAAVMADFIVTPIVNLTVAIERLSMGDLTVEIDPKEKISSDEVKRLVSAFERTLVSLKIAAKLSEKK